MDVTPLRNEDGLTFDEFAARVHICDASEMKSPGRRKRSVQIEYGLGADIKEREKKKEGIDKSINSSKRTPLFQRKTATVHFSTDEKSGN